MGNNHKVACECYFSGTDMYGVQPLHTTCRRVWCVLAFGQPNEGICPCLVAIADNNEGVVVCCSAVE